MKIEERVIEAPNGYKLDKPEAGGWQNHRPMISCKVHGAQLPIYSTQYLDDGSEKHFVLCSKCEAKKKK